MFKIIIPLIPVAKGRPRFNRLSGSAYTPEKTKAFENSCRYYLTKFLWSPERSGKKFEGALKVNIEFFLQRPTSPSCSPKKRPYPLVKPDLDNFIKGVLDSANKVLWKDDAQICEITATKQYGTPPRIIVEVSELELNV